MLTTWLDVWAVRARTLESYVKQRWNETLNVSKVNVISLARTLCRRVLVAGCIFSAMNMEVGSCCVAAGLLLSDVQQCHWLTYNHTPQSRGGTLVHLAKMCRLCVYVSLWVCDCINGLLWFVMTYSNWELLAASDEVLRESSHEWSYLAVDLHQLCHECILSLAWLSSEAAEEVEQEQPRCYKHQPPLFWPFVTRALKRSWREEM